jgi:hypothetical protein
MNSFENDVKDAANWEFLNEPLYKWAIFIAVLLMILFVYQGLIHFFMDE